MQYKTNLKMAGNLVNISEENYKVLKKVDVISDKKLTLASDRVNEALSILGKLIQYLDYESFEQITGYSNKI